MNALAQPGQQAARRGQEQGDGPAGERAAPTMRPVEATGGAPKSGRPSAGAAVPVSGASAKLSYNEWLKQELGAVIDAKTIGPNGRERVDRLPPGPPDLQTLRGLGDISRFRAVAGRGAGRSRLPGRARRGRRARRGDRSAPLWAALTDDRQDVRASSAQALRDTSAAVTRALTALKSTPRDDIFVRQATRSAPAHDR